MTFTGLYVMSDYTYFSWIPNFFLFLLLEILLLLKLSVKLFHYLGQNYTVDDCKLVRSLCNSGVDVQGRGMSNDITS